MSDMRRLLATRLRHPGSKTVSRSIGGLRSNSTPSRSPVVALRTKNDSVLLAGRYRATRSVSSLFTRAAKVRSLQREGMRRGHADRSVGGNVRAGLQRLLVLRHLERSVLRRSRHHGMLDKLCQSLSAFKGHACLE